MLPSLARSAVLSGCWAAALTSSAAAATRGVAVSARVHDWTHAAPIPLGSTLEVAAQHSSVSIAAASSIDTTSIKGSQASMEGAWKLEVQPNEAHPSDASAPPTLRLRELAGSSKGTLSLSIPEKWVSVSVTTGGGNVGVAKVTEAHLSVATKGGNVDLGNIRAINADVHTGGGALQATELSGTSVVVSTEGGPVNLRRLIGQSVTASTGGGALAVGALYGDDISIQTGGSPLHIGTMDCSADVKLSTKGGAIAIDSLDGNAQLRSGGGHVQMHLHSKVGDLSVLSAGGDVSIAVSPDAIVALTIKGTSPLQGDAAADFTASGNERTAHFRPQADPAAKGSREPRWGTLSEGSCVVDAGGGKVTVTRLRWADAVRARLGMGPAAK